MTMAQGSAGLARRRGGQAITCEACGIRFVGASSMALLCRVLRGRAPRVFWLWFGVDRLLTLDVAAEAKAHGREHLFAEGMLLPRAEPGEQRRRDHIRWDRLLDRGLHRPSAFARVLNEAGEILQLWILRQRSGGEIEQPGRNDAAAPPNLRNIRYVQRETF